MQTQPISRWTIELRKDNAEQKAEVYVTKILPTSTGKFTSIRKNQGAWKDTICKKRVITTLPKKVNNLKKHNCSTGAGYFFELIIARIAIATLGIRRMRTTTGTGNKKKGDQTFPSRWINQVS